MYDKGQLVDKNFIEADTTLRLCAIKFWTALLDETIKKEETKIDWEAQTEMP